MPADRLSPKEVLKLRRPERFSDSVVQEIPELHTSTLEYHLDTLTNREQSREFESFARRLAQKAICPNLLPQTGPTGGGDSKVDSETFPVADSLTFSWLVGEPREAASERWGFAFSAKKQWQPKLKSDIAKIADVGREYKKAFFITNQFVPDKARSKLEDELRDKHKIDVRILDRSWIVSQVFENGHIDIAIEELKLPQSLRREVKIGPLDYRKKVQLEELEARIKQEAENATQSPGFVDDCLEAAKLTAGLEEPQSAVDGAFLRAERAAQKYGTKRDQLRVAYQRAWTAYWWYEDYTLFNEQYEIVQKLTDGGQSVYDFELLHNLWQLKFAAIRSGAANLNEDELDSQTKYLECELQRLSDDEERPSAAYHAEGLGLMMQMLQSLDGDTKSVFLVMNDLIASCAGLVGFPFDSFAKVLLQLGTYFTNADGYAELFETLASSIKERRGEIASAKLILERASQVLEANEPVEAIRLIGRSLIDLYKHETRPELVRALYLLAMAYRQLGLFYAARGSMLSAASITTNYFWEHGAAISSQAACYNRIKWLECELGRVPQALDWHQSEMVVREALRKPVVKSDPDRELQFDMLLGVHFLRTKVWQLRWLTKLADTLDRMGLFQSSLSLRFALGDVEGVSKELAEVDGSTLDPEQFFREWRKQAKLTPLPEIPTYGDGQSVLLRSTILGCTITAEASNSLPCLCLAESILAALESFLATGFVDRVVPREPKITLQIREGGHSACVFDFEVDTASLDPQYLIRCNTEKLSKVDPDSQEEIHKAIFKLMAKVIAQVFPPANETLKKWIRDDRAIHRSLSFTTSFVAIKNVLGDSPRTNIANWINQESAEFPLSRSTEWDHQYASQEANQVKATNANAKQEYGDGEIPPSMREAFGRTPHSKLKMISVIREPLWSKAEWAGNTFYVDKDSKVPLAFAFVFENGVAGREIFEDWRRTFGRFDDEDNIQVAVITGIDAARPFAYRVLVGTLMPKNMRDGEYVALKCQVKTIYAKSNDGLKRFIESFHQVKKFDLTFAVYDKSDQWPEPQFHLSIGKQHFISIEAWQVGRNNPLIVGILPDDEPIIPPDQPNAPILSALDALRQVAAGTRSSPRKASAADLRKRRQELKRREKKRRRK